jgi:hypothetical protein
MINARRIASQADIASSLNFGDLVRVNGVPMTYYLREPASKGMGFFRQVSNGVRKIFVSKFKITNGGIKPTSYFEWTDKLERGSQ